MRKNSFQTGRGSVGQMILTASRGSKTNTVGWENSAHSLKADWDILEQLGAGAVSEHPRSQ